MQLSILAIGKMKSGSESELLSRYLERSQKTGRQLGFAGPELHEWKESQSASANIRKSDEASLILSALKTGSQLISLDENGTDLTSNDFAKLLQHKQDTGIPQLAFAIGGADGHGEEINTKAIKKIRFGRLTWPHQLARVMLAEQIYRAITILSGHPYHRN